MAVLPPIQGAASISIGGSTTYTNATSGGTWTSGNTAIAAINSVTGVATGVLAGVTQIIYTVGSDSTALNISAVTNAVITNGINPKQVLDALKNEVLWKSQGVSTSGRYFQDFHPICDETILHNLPNTGGDYNSYISSLNNAVILECVNAAYNRSQLIDRSKLVFQRCDYMLVEQEVQNQSPGQFVGLKLQLAPGDFGIKLNKLTMFFDSDVDFTMYLYNDFTLPPKYSLSVSALAHQQVIVDLSTHAILNYLTPEYNKGGVWYFGYYQEDLGSAKAIYYPVSLNVFRPVTVWSFSAPTYTDPLNERNFRRNIVGANNLTYGLNLEIATYTDATNTIVSNPSLWGNLIGLKMACRLVEICKYSYQTNSVQRAVQALGGIDELNVMLNGRPGNYMLGTPKITGLVQQVEDAIRTVKQGFEPIYEGGIGLR